jgi:PIN domain nuclease of toxin-antitoxin system
MFLMDTCAFLWFLDDDGQLSKNARDVIGKSKELYFSIASMWEIAIKKTINKLDIDESVTDIERICDDYSITILPIKTKYLERLQKLPVIHSDPFDRLIMATALEEGMKLITHDSKIQKYNIDLIW